MNKFLLTACVIWSTGATLACTTLADAERIRDVARTNDVAAYEMAVEAIGGCDWHLWRTNSAAVSVIITTAFTNALSASVSTNDIEHLETVLFKRQYVLESPEWFLEGRGPLLSESAVMLYAAEISMTALYIGKEPLIKSWEEYERLRELNSIFVQYRGAMLHGANSAVTEYLSDKSPEVRQAFIKCFCEASQVSDLESNFVFRVKSPETLRVFRSPPYRHR